MSNKNPSQRLPPEWIGNWKNPERARAAGIKGAAARTANIAAKKAKQDELYAESPKLPGEGIRDYCIRLLEEGRITADNAPGLIGKLLDKEVGNAPTVVVNAELSDLVSEEEATLLINKAMGVKPSPLLVEGEIITDEDDKED